MAKLQTAGSSRWTTELTDFTNDGFNVLVLRPCFYNNNEFITSEINQTLRTGISLHELARAAEVLHRPRIPSEGSRAARRSPNVQAIRFGRASAMLMSVRAIRRRTPRA
jgi:hypothetical protein